MAWLCSFIQINNNNNNLIFGFNGQFISHFCVDESSPTWESKKHFAKADALHNVWTKKMKWFTFLIPCNAIAVNSIIHSFRNNVSFCRSVALSIRYDNFRSRTVVHRRHRCVQKDAKEKSKRRIIIALDSDIQKTAVRTARYAPWYPRQKE